MGEKRRNGSYGSHGDFFFANNVNAVDRGPGENVDLSDHSYTHYGHEDSFSSLVKLFPISSSSSSQSASPSQPQAPTSQAGYIQHPVSKFDTLAGIAIRYGVEVSDIKRLNGLVTNIQLFALKSVCIPPGRHPPSICLSNGSDASRESGSEQTPPRHQYLLDSFQSLRLKSSQEKNSLRGYDQLRSNNNSQELPQSDVEMPSSQNHEDGLFRTSPTYMNPPLSRHRKSRSVANSFEGMDMTGEESKSERWSEKFVRSLQKSESDFPTSLEKKKQTEENGLVGGGSGGGGDFSPIAGKGLAQRSKQVIVGGSGQNVMSLGDSVVVGDGVGSSRGVRKSTSTPSLQDEEVGSSIRWPTSSKRSLKPDLQAASSAGMARPILPMSGWRSKKAVD